MTSVSKLWIGGSLVIIISVYLWYCVHSHLSRGRLIYSIYVHVLSYNMFCYYL